MFKKSLTAILALFAIIFLITACSQATENGQDTNQVPKDEKNSQEKTEPAASQIQLPQEQLQKNDSENASVSSLQKALNQIGYDISQNGTYDDMTTWAVTDYQIQQEDLPVTGIYDEKTRDALRQSLNNQETVEAGAGLAKPDNDSNVISNPHEILSLVNKENALPEGFEPLNLVVPDVRFPFEDFLPKKQMRQVAATALEDMFKAADEAGLELYAQSGYRSYDRQDAIFAANVAEHGEEAANNFSARPGESEHQTGLTMDVTSPDVDFRLITAFGETDEGKWLKQHAAEYGFIIRYPEGKENITQYQYEPWHLRYVGEKAATDIMDQKITLEEYLGEAT
ncbi:D-alanyl-D-alanine carboxypeptidase family protein [Lentibacillus sp.]|uniref:D-alanyl-D-alanine carboxypeptidase family protein n=1 Tax=Lentibacillus sp. TaxID=1925746 RepID=UPI002B4AE254|nr:D-alanyl-D-alanine carboxypeptidase family protein [Lentibacillus sp.]HLS09059.1 D-alanyl-D-alanine carboxypeptidase family protein [Lentibacillus sp.]